MSASPDRGYDLADIAERLQRHTRHAPPESAQLLDSLARGLSGGGADVAGTDLVTAYPPDSLLPDRVPPRWVSGLLWLLRTARDVLIFLPVLWTWYKLGQVLFAFGSAPEGVNFLYGWQQGTFDGASRFEPLSTTAMWVSGFLLGIIALTLLVYLLEGVLTLWGDRTRQREETTRLLALATHLIPARPDSVRQEVRGANDTLRGVRAAMVGMENALGSATGGMHRAATDMRQAADGIVEALTGDPRQQLVDALGTWQTRMEQLAEAIREARTPAELLERIEELTQGAVRGQERMSEQTRRTLELLSEQNQLIERRTTESADFAVTTMDRIAAALENLEKVSGELATAQDTLGTFTGQSANTLREALDQFTQIADDLGFLLKDVRRDVTDRAHGARSADDDWDGEEDQWS